MARVVLNTSAIAGLAADPAILRAVEAVADDVAQSMRSAAPRRTGAGAGSIHVEPAPTPADGFRVSWDSDHFYLRFLNDGTQRGVAARHFAEKAARSAGRR